MAFFKNSELELKQGIKSAVELNDSDAVKTYLSKGANPNGSCGIHHGDLLFLEKAAQNANVDMVETLINFGADLKLALRVARHRFDEKKYSKETFEKILKILLDFAVGISLPEIHGLNLFKGINIGGFNLIGVYSDKYPITAKRLVDNNIFASSKVFISMNDRSEMEASRSNRIAKQLEKKFNVEGCYIDNEGIINLVPLYYLAEVGDLNGVICRINAGVNPNLSLEKMPAPLILAAQKGHLPIVKFLMECANLDKQLILPAMQAAKRADHLEIFNLLSQTSETLTDENGNTLLHYAAKDNDVERVCLLISKGLNVNLANLHGETSLECAVAESRLDNGESEISLQIINILLANNAIVTERIILKAIELGRHASSVSKCEVIKLLLTIFLKNNSSENKLSYTEFMFAAFESKDCLQILSLLKNVGANFNSKNKDGQTLLHKLMTEFLYNFQFDEIIKILDFLLKNDADPKITDDKLARTPLHFLFNDGYNNLWYIEHDVQKEFPSDCYEQIISRLINKGLDLKSADLNGDTVYGMAYKKNFSKALQILESFESTKKNIF